MLNLAKNYRKNPTVMPSISTALRAAIALALGLIFPLFTPGQASARGTVLSYFAKVQRSSPANPSYPAARALDLSAGTFAEFAPFSSGIALVDIDLGAVRSIDSVEVVGVQDDPCSAPAGNCAVTDLVVVASDASIAGVETLAPTRDVTNIPKSYSNTTKITLGNIYNTRVAYFHRTARYIRVASVGGKTLRLSEVKIYESDNLGRGLSPTGSSTASNLRYALDGDMNRSVGALTNVGIQAYWQVQLRNEWAVGRIDITPMAGYPFSQAVLLVSTTPLTSSNPASYQNSATVTRIPLADGDGVRSIDVGRRAKYLRIQNTSSKPLSIGLAEVQIWPNKNMALNAAWANQSSTYDNASANRAIDGRVDGSWGGGSLTHTQGSESGDKTPYWEVDLRNARSIDSITIWNRTDCCGDRLGTFAIFYTEAKPFSSSDTYAGLRSRIDVKSIVVPSSYFTSNRITVPLPPDALARYVRIQLESDNYLSLAEVEFNSRESGTITTPKAADLSAEYQDNKGRSLSFSGTAVTNFPNPIIQIEAAHCANGTCNEDNFSYQWFFVKGESVAATTAVYGPHTVSPTRPWSAEVPFSAFPWTDFGINRFRIWLKDGENRSLLNTVLLDNSINPAGQNIHVSGFSSNLGNFTNQLPYLLAKGYLSTYETPEYYAAIDKLGLAVNNLTDFRKRYFGTFPTLEAYPESVRFYNGLDLGLGRNLSCRITAEKLTACFVQNFSGDLLFGRPVEAISRMENFPHLPDATVVMITRGALPEGAPNRVIFAAFDDKGNRLTSLRLDTPGKNQSVPGTCIVCHGGTYDSATNSVSGANLLPLDLDGFQYSSKWPRDVYESTYRRFNDQIAKTIAGSHNADLVSGWYNGANPSVFDGSFTPAGWNRNPSQKLLWQNTIRPYCRSCHGTMTGTLSFANYEDVAESIYTPLIFLDLCKTRTMPNAYETHRAMVNKNSARGQLANTLGFPPSQCEGDGK
jgi:F5/8 type C domain